MAAPTNAVDRLLEKIVNNLGRTNDSVVTDYKIVWANEAQREVCNRANFWFMHTSATLAVSQSATETALASNFKDEDAFWIIETNPDAFTELFPMSIEDERRKWDDVTEAQPSEWRVDASNNLVLRPVPDAAYNIKVDYWAYLTDLVAAGSSNELLDNYPGILEAGATFRGFRRLGEMEDAAAWKAIFEEDVKNLMVENAERVLPDEFVLRMRPDALGAGNRRIKGRLR